MVDTILGANYKKKEIPDVEGFSNPFTDESFVLPTSSFNQQAKIQYDRMKSTRKRTSDLIELDPQTAESMLLNIAGAWEEGQLRNEFNDIREGTLKQEQDKAKQKARDKMLIPWTNQMKEAYSNDPSMQRHIQGNWGYGQIMSRFDGDIIKAKAWVKDQPATERFLNNRTRDSKIYNDLVRQRDDIEGRLKIITGIIDERTGKKQKIPPTMRSMSTHLKKQFRSLNDQIDPKINQQTDELKIIDSMKSMSANVRKIEKKGDGTKGKSILDKLTEGTQSAISKVDSLIDSWVSFLDKGEEEDKPSTVYKGDSSFDPSEETVPGATTAPVVGDKMKAMDAKVGRKPLSIDQSPHQITETPNLKEKTVWDTDKDTIPFVRGKSPQSFVSGGQDSQVVSIGKQTGVNQHGSPTYEAKDKNGNVIGEASEHTEGVSNPEINGGAETHIRTVYPDENNPGHGKKISVDESAKLVIEATKKQNSKVAIDPITLQPIPPGGDPQKRSDKLTSKPFDFGSVESPINLATSPATGAGGQKKEIVDNLYRGDYPPTKNIGELVEGFKNLFKFSDEQGISPAVTQGTILDESKNLPPEEQATYLEFAGKVFDEYILRVDHDKGELGPGQMTGRGGNYLGGKILDGAGWVSDMAKKLLSREPEGNVDRRDPRADMLKAEQFQQRRRDERNRNNVKPDDTTPAPTKTDSRGYSKKAIADAKARSDFAAKQLKTDFKNARKISTALQLTEGNDPTAVHNLLKSKGGKLVDTGKPSGAIGSSGVTATAARDTNNKKINNLIKNLDDDRIRKMLRDPKMNTYISMAYFIRLHKQLRDQGYGVGWSDKDYEDLVSASYNGGAGRVKAGLDESQADNMSELMKWMDQTPKEDYRQIHTHVTNYRIHRQNLGRR